MRREKDIFGQVVDFLFDNLYYQFFVEFHPPRFDQCIQVDKIFFTRFLHCKPVWYMDHFVFEMPIKILQKHLSHVHRRVHALLCVEYPDTIAAAVASTTAATVVATTAVTATTTTTAAAAAAAAAAVAARATRLLL